MSPGARVTRTETLSEFELALKKFSEEAAAALVSVDMEIRRMLDWLGVDQPRRWDQELDRLGQRLAEVKADYSRKRLANVGEHASLVEEKEALQHARRRIEWAEEKRAACRRWALSAERAVNEYRGAVRPLANRLEHELPGSLAALHAMIGALEDYLAQAPPSARPPPTGNAPAATTTRVVPPGPDSGGGGEASAAAGAEAGAEEPA